MVCQQQNANLAKLLAEGHMCLWGLPLGEKRNLPQMFATGEEPGSLSCFKGKVTHRCEFLMEENMCGIMGE